MSLRERFADAVDWVMLIPHRHTTPEYPDPFPTEIAPECLGEGAFQDVLPLTAVWGDGGKLRALTVKTAEGVVRLTPEAPHPTAQKCRCSTKPLDSQPGAGESGSPQFHELKCWPGFFDDIASGRKTFEVRRNDRGFQVGDTLLVREYDDGCDGGELPYTGRECERRVTYLLPGGPFGLDPDFCVMSIAPTQPSPESGSEEETERCKYCDGEFPKPVELHHSEEECSPPTEHDEHGYPMSVAKKYGGCSRCANPQPESGSGEEGERSPFEQAGDLTRWILDALDKCADDPSDEESAYMQRRIETAIKGWFSSYERCGGEPTNPTFFGRESEDELAGPDGYCRGCPDCFDRPAPTQPPQGSQVEREWLIAGDYNGNYVRSGPRFEPGAAQAVVPLCDLLAAQAQLQRVEEENRGLRQRVALKMDDKHAAVLRAEAKREADRATQAEGRIQRAVEEFETQAKELRRRHDIDPPGPGWMRERSEVWQKAANYLRSQPSSEVEEGHRVEVTFDDTGLGPMFRLFHPARGCDPGEGKAGTCWLDGWLENADPPEGLVRGRLTVPVERTELDGDQPIFYLAPASPSTPAHKEEK